MQAEHQRALGLDPLEMTEPQRRTALTEMLAQTHEEVTELGRLTPTYKRHILRSPRVNPQDAAEAVADALKCLVTWAQLMNLGDEEVMEAFRRKTLVMARRMEGERLQMEQQTRLLCVDLDDVVVDITEFRRILDGIKGGTYASVAEQHRVEEAFKDGWYREGKFMACPSIEGAPEALRALRAAGILIALITARPQWQYKRIQADTVTWLMDHQCPHDLLLFNKDKCEAIHDHIQPAWPMFFVEDHDRNARALSAIGVSVLLFDQPHNRNMAALPNVRRVFSWTEILNIVGVTT